MKERCGFGKLNWRPIWSRRRRRAGKNLLNLFANTLTAQDPRRQKLIAAVLDDFERLARDS
jgi:hypothetical protein